MDPRTLPRLLWRTKNPDQKAYAPSKLDERRAKLMQQWADYVLPRSADHGGDNSALLSPQSGFVVESASRLSLSTKPRIDPTIGPTEISRRGVRVPRPFLQVPLYQCFTKRDCVAVGGSLPHQY